MSNHEISLTIQFHSDFHIGTGFGLARILDDRLHKDPFGNPYLPGSTIKALLRDAAERLLQLEPLKGVLYCAGEYEFREKSKKGEYATLCGVVPVKTRITDENDEIPDLNWYCPLCRVFGTAYHPAGFYFSAANVPAKLTTPINALSNNKKAFKDEQFNPAVIDSIGRPRTMVASYNRIERKTGRVEDAKLFNFELGPSGLSLDAVISELNYPEDILARQQNWILLAAAAAYVEEAGKRRRRGSGQCTFRLDELSREFKDALSLPATQKNVLIENLDKLLVPVGSTTSGLQQVTKLTGNYSSRYLVAAYLEEPLIISKRTEAGNTVSTLSYINGTSLRGALATSFLRKYGLTDPSQLPGQLGEEFEKLFGQETIRFSNLLPAKADYWPDRQEITLVSSIPAPRSVFTCKRYSGPKKKEVPEPHGIHDYLLEEIDEKCPICKSQLEGYDGFLLPAYGTKPWSEAEIKREIIMHNEVNDRNSRAEDARLFSYEVLRPDGWFAGVIEEMEQFGVLGDLLAVLGIPDQGGTLKVKLGRATSRGQGQVTLRFIRIEEDYPQPALLVEDSFEERIDRFEKGWLALLLASDCILQDDNLRYLDHISGEYLAELLDTPQNFLEIDTSKSFCTTRIVEGWNFSHGLPKETEVAIEAGSVFCYRLSEQALLNREVLLAALKRLEQRGIGVRRDEGFGRVVFNHPAHLALKQFSLKG